MTTYELLTPDGMVSSDNVGDLVDTRILSCTEDGTATWETVQAAIVPPVSGPDLVLPTLGLTLPAGLRLIARTEVGLLPVTAEDLTTSAHPVMTAPNASPDDRDDPTVDDGVLYRTGERIQQATSGIVKVGDGRWMWEQIAPAHVQVALFSLSRRQVGMIMRGLFLQDDVLPSVVMCNKHPEVANLLRHLLTPHGWTVDITLIPHTSGTYGAAHIKTSNTFEMGHGATDLQHVKEPNRTPYPVTASGRYFAFSPTNSALYSQAVFT